MTHAIAVQPKAWGTFDPHGCDWAANMDHAHRLCSVWLAKYGEPMVIWKCPAKGNPMPWVTVTPDNEHIEAITSLLFD